MTPADRSTIGRGVDSTLFALYIAERLDDFEHFAARREHPAAATLVLVHRAHKLDFVQIVISLAGGRVDLPATADLRTAFAYPTLDGDGSLVNAPLGHRSAIAICAALSAVKRNDGLRLGSGMMLLGQLLRRPGSLAFDAVRR